MAATGKKKRTRRTVPMVKVPAETFARVEAYLRHRVDKAKCLDAAMLLGALGATNGTAVPAPPSSAAAEGGESKDPAEGFGV